MPTGSGKTYVYDPVFSVKHRIIEISAILRMKYELEHGSSNKVIVSHTCVGTTCLQTADHLVFGS